MTTKELSKTEISNMSDREFKAMVIKILTRLDKRVRDLKDIFKK